MTMLSKEVKERETVIGKEGSVRVNSSLPITVSLSVSFMSNVSSCICIGDLQHLPIIFSVNYFFV